MKFSQKVYDLLQWFIRIFIPAFVVFYIGVDQFFDLPKETEVAGVAGLLAIFLGALLQKSTSDFKKNNEVDAGIVYSKGSDPDTGIADLGFVVNKLPDELLSNKTVTFKVGELPPELRRRYYEGTDDSLGSELDPPG